MFASSNYKKNYLTEIFINIIISLDSGKVLRISNKPIFYKKYSKNLINEIYSHDNEGQFY